jgi:hypothetical protein
VGFLIYLSPLTGLTNVLLYSGKQWRFLRIYYRTIQGCNEKGLCIMFDTDIWQLLEFFFLSLDPTLAILGLPFFLRDLFEPFHRRYIFFSMT